MKYFESHDSVIGIGGQPPLDSSQFRECRTCLQRWPSFFHYLGEPTPRPYLACKGCCKRIPVGQDIRELPKRRAHANAIDLDGNPMVLELDSLKINTRQQCTAEDYPLKKKASHSVGLYPTLETENISKVAALV